MTELKEEKKTGLVLEGGGMRGIYTAGVLDVFLDHDISFDGVIGVSAGAVHGASFVSGQKERSIRYYKKYCNDKRFMSFKNWLRTGNLVDEQFCFHDIPERLDPYDYEAFDRGRYTVLCGMQQCGDRESRVSGRSKICSKMSNISVRRHPFRMCPIWSRLVE